MDKKMMGICLKLRTLFHDKRFNYSDPLYEHIKSSILPVIEELAGTENENKPALKPACGIIKDFSEYNYLSHILDIMEEDYEDKYPGFVEIAKEVIKMIENINALTLAEKSVMAQAKKLADIPTLK